REQDDEAHEHGRTRDPPAVPERPGEPHHDQDRKAHEEEEAAETDPVLERPRAVALAGHAVAPLPPEPRDPERELSEPDEREPEHREQHPGTDPTGRGLPCQPGPYRA